ncbi:protein MpPOD110 [Marchantia polymorpha subsp. ruderalis]|uniref:Plant heme peroxidase family profile domain-containing protein n=1 Tax=Marchantia polymorpha subsp. ruderalis TaxID=1480154 RepID=A0AAF6BIC9_MARPO|nr:hypothetical protein Mp_5g14520 [Marchantia polymorpha subsp. ruderalis]
MGGGAIPGVARGRRDGVQFLASEANTDLPPPLPDYDSVVSMLAEKGLNARDMDLLSGSHTVEKENCAVMQSGLDSHGPEIAPRFC